MSSISNLASWSALEQHRHALKDTHLRDMFAEDPQRGTDLSVEFGPLYFDYSKHRLNSETIRLLLAFAEERGLSEHINALFQGDAVNWTERRAASHVALRNRGNEPMFVDGVDVGPSVSREWAKMRRFCDDIRSCAHKGYSGKAIQSVVNIGIGGSGLGSKMVVDALRHYADGRLKVHFVENVDPNNIIRVLAQCNPATTLFIVTSKTFTTLETMANAELAKKWFLGQTGNEGAVKEHFIAVTAAPDVAKSFGIVSQNVFEFWDWVGGRYSLWSAVGLPVALALGMDGYEELLEGAHAMDMHFRQQKFEENIPVLMALIGIWYNNFWQAKTHCMAIYDERLHRFVPYLQQLDMESNGKSVDRDGSQVDYSTGPIIWGGVGTNAQHAFFQLLHQGAHLVPTDFIAVKQGDTQHQQSHQILLANCVAQAEALMVGKENKDAPHRNFEGDQPSSTLIMDRLTPYNLGMLTALYEHKTFVQGALWGINPFDQWGVELGKSMAYTALRQLTNGSTFQHDSSTENLLKRLAK